ncbi:MAG: NAD(P)H-dependent oxidoreductase [Devosia sp.]
MRIYVLLGHPDTDSFNGALADAYCAAATAAGHEVRRQNIGELQFDPILHHGYRRVQPLETDLIAAQANLSWCQHWAVFYPVWWGNVPALLKGFFDRTLYSEFAYRYHDEDPLWDKLLKGRSGRIVTTSDAPAAWLWLQYRNSDLNAVRRATMEFCGVSPVRVTRIDRMKYLDTTQRQAWLTRLAREL